MKQIRTINNKLGDIDEVHETLMFKFNQLEEEAKQKADLRQLTKLEIELENYATQKEIARLNNRLESYTSLESFNTMRIELENTLAQLNARFTKIPVNNDLSNAINKTKAFVTALNENNSLKRDCFKDKNDLTKMIEGCEEESRKLADLIRKQAKNIANVEAILDKKIDREDMESFKKIIATLPTQIQISNLNELITSSIAEFGRDNHRFKQEFEVHLGIIRRYDEVLTTKASKSAIYEIEQRIKRELEP